MRLLLALAVLLVAAPPVAALPVSLTDGTAALPAGTPAVSSCGTNPVLSSGAGNDRGVITIGTGVVTACTLSFSATLAAAPTCVISSSNSAIGLGWSTSTTALTIAMSASLAGGAVSYMCLP